MLNPIIEKCQQDEDLSWEEYTEGVLRTASGKFHGDSYSLEAALAVMNNFIQAGELLDQMKKALYYGRDVQSVHEQHIKSLAIQSPLTYSWGSLDQSMMHGLIGISTEAVELVEALARYIQTDGQVLDKTNLNEELGDLFWYVALTLYCLGTLKDINPIMRLNLLKLYARFPDKFTEASANHRDLSLERSVLETNAL